MLGETEAQLQVRHDNIVPGSLCFTLFHPGAAILNIFASGIWLAPRVNMTKYRFVHSLTCLSRFCNDWQKQPQTGSQVLRRQ